ncbi:hypothetical protein MHB50_09320 [Siminovitchia sp. FSL H7-0308]|uniref:hypothetical protein n=1 Tax=Siminovitchia sp. FSL H7-0308 TaxID=2921432 RepID=UPI0030EDF674
MIPIEVENRIAKYFLHMFLPVDVLIKIEDRLLPACIWTKEEDLDHDELVRWAIDIMDRQLENKRLR